MQRGRRRDGVADVLGAHQQHSKAEQNEDRAECALKGAPVKLLMEPAGRVRTVRLIGPLRSGNAARHAPDRSQTGDGSGGSPSGPALAPVRSADGTLLLHRETRNRGTPAPQTAPTVRPDAVRYAPPTQEPALEGMNRPIPRNLSGLFTSKHGSRQGTFPKKRSSEMLLRAWNEPLAAIVASFGVGKGSFPPGRRVFLPTSFR